MSCNFWINKKNLRHNGSKLGNKSERINRKELCCRNFKAGHHQRPARKHRRYLEVIKAGQISNRRNKRESQEQGRDRGKWKAKAKALRHRNCFILDLQNRRHSDSRPVHQLCAPGRSQKLRQASDLAAHGEHSLYGHIHTRVFDSERHSIVWTDTLRTILLEYGYLPFFKEVLSSNYWKNDRANFASLPLQCDHLHCRHQHGIFDRWSISRNAHTASVHLPIALFLRNQLHGHFVHSALNHSRMDLGSFCDWND